MTPAEIAKLAADRARIRALVARAERQNSMIQDAAGTYAGYDADNEQHLVRTPSGIQPVQHLLTNAGLDKGDPVEFQNGALDAMPRTKPQPKPEPPSQDPDPVWSVLVKRRAFVRTGSAFIPPVEAEYSDPVPALYSMIYYSRRHSPDGLPELWDQSEQRRYCRGTSDLLCGSHYTDPLTNRNSDPYCRTSLAPWRLVPEANQAATAFAQNGCHYAFAIKYPNPPYEYGWLGGIVIGCWTFASDGIAAVPTEPPIALPEVHLKVENDGSLPPQENFLACDTEQGAEIDMQWEFIEAIKLADYVPPKLTRPPYPGGTFSYAVYESQFWLVTPRGSTKILTVPDWVTEGITVIPQSFEVDVSALIAINEAGTAHIDFKIIPIDDKGDTQPVELRHFQAQGGSSRETEKSGSWRRLLTNSTTDQPLMGTYSHPCVKSYQAMPGANILETDRKLIRTPSLTSVDFQKGIVTTFNVWGLPEQAACSLPTEPEITEQLLLPPFDPKSVGYDERDETGIQIMGFVAYV